MKLNTEQLAKFTKQWLERTHLGRTDEERRAYQEGVEDALNAVFGDTSQGAYPAHEGFDLVDTILFPDHQE